MASEKHPVLMEVVMRGNGSTENPMEEEHTLTPTAILFLDNGRMVKFKKGLMRKKSEFFRTDKEDMKKPKKIVLAYSGGLDTSVMLAWLKERYGCEIITYTADIGQKGEISSARRKAKKMGVERIIVDDLKDEFVTDFIFPMFRANTVYEVEYLLGTSIARPLIAKKLVDVAKKFGADAIAHGATGKGNDQVRFELSAYALDPKISIIAPWREWDLLSREKLLNYAKSRKIPVDFKTGAKGPYSMDANLLHISYEGGILEDPNNGPEESMWRMTRSIKNSPESGTTLELEFKHGDLSKVNGKKDSPAKLLAKLNTIGGKNGVGRADIVENRFIGMKSRGCYETPGGSIILKAHRAIESITLDREVVALKDDLMPRYARLIYNGYWFSPERALLQGLIDESQKYVNGIVKVKLHKGNIIILGRHSKRYSLYDKNMSTFDDDKGTYRQADAEGFIKLNALRLKNVTKRVKK